MILDVTRLLSRVEIRGGAGSGKTSSALVPGRVKATRLVPRAVYGRLKIASDPGSTSAIVAQMGRVGLREPRQDASDLVRRAEAGEEITITVSGRPSARLVAADRQRWCSWSQIADLFDGPQDAEWGTLRELVDDTPRDPWAPR